MKLKLKKPIVVLDLEATGDQITKDRIVEIGMIKISPDGSESIYDKRVNPQIPIPINISEIHGIYDIDIKDCPTFKDLANEINLFIDNSDICGFNSNKFDVPLLEEEFQRAGVSCEINENKLIDVQNIYHKMEKRTLGAAYQFYCSKELINAHSAINDARATLEVLLAQTEKYDELEGDVNFLSKFSKANQNAIDYASRIIQNEFKEPIINFGKHKGKKVIDVFDKEPGYYSWIMRGDFPLNTKSCFTEIWKEFKKES